MQKPDRQLGDRQVCFEETIREHILEHRPQPPKT
jgi:hypothetical protein